LGVEVTEGTAARTGKLFDDGRWLVLLVLLPVACFELWSKMTSDTAVAWGIFSPLSVSLIEPATATTSMETALMAAAANRLNSVASTTLLVFVSIGVGAYAWLSVWRSPKSQLDRQVLWGLAAVLLLIVLHALDGNWMLEKLGLLDKPPEQSHQVYRFLGTNVFDHAIGSIGGGEAIALLNRQLVIGNHAVALAAIGIVVSSAFIAVRATRLGTAADGPTVLELKNQLDLTLMIAAMLLVAGVIDTKQWTALPEPFMAKEMRTAYTAMVNGFVALESVCFVGVLVSIFLPSALLLDRARRRIRLARGGGEEAGSPPTPDAKPEGVAFTDLIRVVALLAPVLAGPIATFVSIKLPA
jgi:hypothetical protein